MSIIIEKIKNLKPNTRFKCLSEDVFKTYVLYGRTHQTNKNFVRFLLVVKDTISIFIHGDFYITDDDMVTYNILGPSKNIDIFGEMDIIKKMEEANPQIKFSTELFVG